VSGWEVLSLTAAVAVALVLLTLWLVWTAGRLDRQHLRLEAARSALDAQLARRAALASEVAAGGSLDPASALLVIEAATHAQSTSGEERWQAESELTAVLLGAGVPGADVDLSAGELRDASRRVAMARRIHNDLAVAADGLHDRRRVRWFRLAGHAERPGLVEFDDRSPP
jgi:hypothetical protein